MTTKAKLALAVVLIAPKLQILAGLSLTILLLSRSTLGRSALSSFNDRADFRFT